MTHEAAHQFDKQGRKGLEGTKRNVSKAKDGVQKFREKRAAESMKRQTVRTSGNKTIKAVEQTEKTIKQSARSTGKKTIKTAGKAQPKPHRGRSRPRKRQSRPHSRRQRRHRKPHRLR